MTKEEALMMAIEALDNADYHRADEAIVIIKEVLAQSKHSWIPEHIVGLAKLEMQQIAKLKDENT